MPFETNTSRGEYESRENLQPKAWKMDLIYTGGQRSKELYPRLCNEGKHYDMDDPTYFLLDRTAGQVISHSGTTSLRAGHRNRVEGSPSRLPFIAI